MKKMEYIKFTKFYESYFGEEIENPDSYLEKITALDLKDFVEHCMEFNNVVLADVSERSCDLISAAFHIKALPYDQAVQQIKVDLTGQPETVVINGRLRVYFEPAKPKKTPFGYFR